MITTLGQYNGAYLFAPRKKEHTDAMIAVLECKLNEWLGATEEHPVSYSYTVISSMNDVRINGYSELLSHIQGRVDFKSYNLIIAKPEMLENNDGNLLTNG